MSTQPALAGDPARPAEVGRGAHRVRLLATTLTPAALGAGLVVGFEVVRTVMTSTAELGAMGSLSFGFAVLGLLGLPLFLGGVALLGGASAARAGWRFGQAGAPPIEPARWAAWVLAGLLMLAVLVVGVQLATVKFIQLFRKPVYQGLGAGLTAAALVAGSALLAGPVVGLLYRAFRALSPRLPRFLDPTRLQGAAVWAGVLLVVGLVLAPVLRPELATVDLGPARLMVAWLALLLGLRWWVGRHVGGARRSWPWAAGAGVFAVAAGAAVLWSAVALGQSQGRLLALDRDTLLAGRVSALLAGLGDRDGDGVPGAFRGGDCDDHNPAIRPGVVDPPDDGVDQNCTGADMRKAQDPLKIPRRDPPVAPRADWHVVVLTIDALRFDTYRKQMPHLAALAAESVEFTHAYAHGNSTYWSIPSLMASTVPSRLEMGRDQTPVPAMTLMAEVLQGQGWHTALFANVTIFFIRGLRQGTDVGDYSTSEFTVHGAKPGSAFLTDGLLRHVDAFLGGTLQPRRDRFFLWGHYYDPHDPYFEVEGFPADDGSDKAHYEAIVRYTDRELGRLVDGLKSRGLWEKTVLILTADHGDEFLDHGHRFHGHSLYEEMVHVPLIVHVPGIPARTLDVPIGHMEVMPTLLDLLGLAAPKGWLGRSRAEEVRTGTPAVAQPIYFEALPDSNYKAHQVGVRLGPLKLIHRIRENGFELYDLIEDPLEHHNVVDTHPQAATLRALLGVYLDHHLAHLALGKTGAEVFPPAEGK